MAANAPRFGDWVWAYDSPIKMLVIGFMAYGEGDSMPLLATERTWGMPINASWCKFCGGTDRGLANVWRARYEALYPGLLKPLDKFDECGTMRVY